MNIAGSNNIFTIKSYEEFDVTSMNVTKEITDASGIRTITYNEYNEASSESLNGDELNHLISETQDSYGRNTGYSYSKAGILQQSVNIGYGEEGRIATAGFLHEGIEQQFSYSYLEGSHLLHTLAHPNNILLSNTYEEQRNLITSMNVTRGTTDVILRSYSYDALARPLSRSCSRQAISRNDSFTYNTRSELIQAELGTKHYAYSYDNIGNRKTAQELAEESTYEANQLNQYSTITQSQTSFTPTFDADGNQTLIKTSSGIWSVTYNADKRPTSFSQAQGDQRSIIECGYDYMGRRYMKKVTSNGTVSLHQRYIYRGYLQIACVDLSRSEHPALWYITWDPTEPIATRPLAIQKNATWYSYSHDLTKNVTELYQSEGLIATTYDYSPYGAATAEGIDQPIQYSSEYHDPELALTYYNYRHYNPTDGRWINRDPIGMQSDHNLYAFVGNNAIIYNDSLGLASFPWDGDWGSGNTSRGNCYRFACNDPMLSGEPHFKRPNNILPDMRGNFICNEVTKNLPKNVKKSGNNGDCPKCYYKIQVVIRPKNILMQDPKKRLSDFHFYRQNPNDSWSHKPGNTPVINNVIDPGADARRSNYTENCGAYCVPEGGENVD